MKTFIAKQEIRDLLNKVIMDEVSFTRMVEIMNERVNERVSEAEKPCVEDIPVRKFQDGDKVVLKSGCENIQSGFSYYDSMDQWIGKPITVNGINSDDHIYGFDDCPWNFAEDWLEPYEGLKEGDLAIFWDVDKGSAFIGEYDYFIRDVPFPHNDHRGNVFANAVKFESIEQYKKLLKGEI